MHFALKNHFPKNGDALGNTLRKWFIDAYVAPDSELTNNCCQLFTHDVKEDEHYPLRKTCVSVTVVSGSGHCVDVDMEKENSNSKRKVTRIRVLARALPGSGGLVVDSSTPPFDGIRFSVPLGAFLFLSVRWLLLIFLPACHPASLNLLAHRPTWYGGGNFFPYFFSRSCANILFLFQCKVFFSAFF